MNIDATFLPVAKELIDQVFPTTVAYLRNEVGNYNPATGEVTQNTTQFDIKAGVLSRGRTEEGGVAETQELRLWIHHGTGGLPHLPTTSDQVEYAGLVWKVASIDPTYSSEDLIASKIVARCN
tara:strand:+ start:9150 stop:9518 length:369 start_codon:yes stop_codon:yes gene_type:complete